MNFRAISFCVLFTFLALLSQSNAAPHNQATCVLRAGHADFGYEPSHKYSPARWHLLEGNEVCGSGELQSPIDLTIDHHGNVVHHGGDDDDNDDDDNDDDDGDDDGYGHGKQCNKFKRPKIVMKESEVQYAEDHHNFKFECKHNCGHIVHKHKKYHFDQVHFHHLSEHTVNGEHFPMEAHFVHKTDDGSIAVLAVFIETHGDKHLGFQRLMGAAVHKGSTVVDMKSLYDSAGNLYATMGSLTTPPCTEGVQWFISTGRVYISKEQLKLFFCMMGHEENNRPVQDKNGRCIQRV